MSRLHAFRNQFVDAPGSVGARFRARRWDWLRATFPGLEAMAVIDLGGTAEAWRRAPVRPASVHIVNLEKPPEDLPSWLRSDHADACELPAEILAGSYDLVISNSVVEHVGGHARRQMFADAVHRLADRHWIQTPYRYFPVEPHWVCPGMQFLPAAARATVARHWPLVHTPPADRAEALRSVLEVELLSRTEMRAYFPRSVILPERVAGLTKSLVAVKRS
ncbi:class I SAM-dependent methyltransferase [Actinomadura terrae]|uniref:class I SAM-dependent methyltransferase n=1 Tax=Actinomadura terrae TaxID=604353 RepID=UPI001FA81537|nr:class I SAM-dependent methyltransferase [Actinomadura terrae]